ncbi:MAG: cytochrome b/b6 domain-containing protein [Novosphingobium sp.]
MTIEEQTRTVILWDLPVRLVHWAFVGLMPALWWTARNGKLDLHEKIGMTMLGLVVFRLLWGVVGSSTARFASFVRGPAAVMAYLRGMRSSDSVPIVGHNPLGGLSVIALLGLLGAQVTLGLFAQDTDGIFSGPLNHLVSWDTASTMSAAHGLVFNLILLFVVVHIAAIAFYRIAKRDNLVGPMVSGRKRFAESIVAPRIAPLWRALVIAAIASTIAVWLAWGAPPWGSPFPWDKPADVVDEQSYM